MHGRQSYWEEVEMIKQIHVLIKLGKMKNSEPEYACRVNLLIKKDGSRWLYGDYRPLNM
jgi:hypothetical protein